jgi:transposase InsO family protein
MEEQWIIDRAKLRQLLHEHPTWSTRQYAEEVGRCRKWVQKWKKRLLAAEPGDQQVLYSQSRARKTPPEPYHPDVISRILELREDPPAEVPRVLGAPTILYYLHRDPDLKERRLRLPRSTSTIWKILNDNQCILRRTRPERQPFDLPPVMNTWEIDFTDVATAQATHDRKQQHQVEAFAVVDRGSSILVDLQASDNYQAQTAVTALVQALMQQGLPRVIVFDRDPRFIGSWSAQEFPSAFMRLLLCLGITLEMCPPRRPDLKPFVERYFRTLKSECVRIQQPETVAATQEVFTHHQTTYNELRPNQAQSCGNRTPYEAFPVRPQLPALPPVVDPDRWLLSYHQRLFKRRVDSAGRVQIGKHRYYIRRALAKRYVVCRLNAHRREFDIILDDKVIKSFPVKGLFNGQLTFEAYYDLICKEAEAEWRQHQHKQRLRAA